MNENPFVIEFFITIGTRHDMPYTLKLQSDGIFVVYDDNGYYSSHGELRGDLAQLTDALKAHFEKTYP